MKFTRIEIAKTNTGAWGTITTVCMQEILLTLNSRNYCNRQIPKDNSYKTPKGISWDKDDCHSTARKFAAVNNGWVKVSGYIIQRKDLSVSSNKVDLWAHSLIKDTNNNLIELMADSFQLEESVFIKHNSGSCGYDLWAVT